MMKLSGTANQIEMATEIRECVAAEFDRVAAAFRTVALRQAEPACSDTREIMQILEEKRAAVMANDSAGYFIQTWRELSDQVRRMIGADPRYRAIQDRRQDISRSRNDATVHSDRIHAR